ncbi:MAG: hypothetical protein LUE87_05230 [Lachnospiraceae bacterium]|nr:hypothetical protein [Lachnospiraceae bacterium]
MNKKRNLLIAAAAVVVVAVLIVYTAVSNGRASMETDTADSAQTAESTDSSSSESADSAEEITVDSENPSASSSLVVTVTDGTVTSLKDYPEEDYVTLGEYIGMGIPPILTIPAFWTARPLTAVLLPGMIW